MKLSALLLGGSTILPLALALPTEDASSISTRCPNVKILLARATMESQDDEESIFVWPLGQQVKEKNPGSTVESLVYPASWTSPTYKDSQHAGYVATQDWVKRWSSECPSTKLVLIGFSQGAQVVLDAMCGGGVKGPEGGHASDHKMLGDLAPPLEPELQNHVVAIAQFGDPRTMKRAPYNKGTRRSQGLFPRQKYQMCSNETAAKVTAYCDYGDHYCDNGNKDEVHTRAHYQPLYYDEAAAFIQQKIDAAS